jgi:hypothetical protein
MANKEERTSAQHNTHTHKQKHVNCAQIISFHSCAYWSTTLCLKHTLLVFFSCPWAHCVSILNAKLLHCLHSHCFSLHSHCILTAFSLHSHCFSLHSHCILTAFSLLLTAFYIFLASTLYTFTPSLYGKTSLCILTASHCILHIPFFHSLYIYPLIVW